MSDNENLPGNEMHMAGRFNMIDKNTYFLNLNNQSNSMYGAFVLLFICVLYFFIIYLVSFMYLPIAQTLPQEYGMFVKFMNMVYGNPSNFNPATIAIGVTDNTNDAFTLINPSTTINTIQSSPWMAQWMETIDKNTKNVQDAFNRFYLKLYMKNGAISTTQPLNKRSLFDVRI